MEVFQDRVEKAIAGRKMERCRELSYRRDLIWPKAEAVIWLDYPFMTVFWQLSRRIFKRWWTGEVLWGTNVELFLSISRSGQRILFSTGCLNILAQETGASPYDLAEYPHLQLVRFAHPKETQKWLKSF